MTAQGHTSTKTSKKYYCREREITEALEAKASSGASRDFMDYNRYLSGCEWECGRRATHLLRARRPFSDLNQTGKRATDGHNASDAPVAII
jgi:hypothetical protein